MPDYYGLSSFHELLFMSLFHPDSTLLHSSTLLDSPSHVCNNIPLFTYLLCIFALQYHYFRFHSRGTQLETPSTTTNPVGMASHLVQYLVVRSILSIRHSQTSGDPV
jgi:hypothetical protein